MVEDKTQQNDIFKAFKEIIGKLAIYMFKDIN